MASPRLADRPLPNSLIISELQKTALSGNDSGAAGDRGSLKTVAKGNKAPLGAVPKRQRDVADIEAVEAPAGKRSGGRMPLGAAAQRRGMVKGTSTENGAVGRRFR